MLVDARVSSIGEEQTDLIFCRPLTQRFCRGKKEAPRRVVGEGPRIYLTLRLLPLELNGLLEELV